MDKRLFAGVVALGLLTFGALGSAYAQSDSQWCNNALIHGTYGFTIEGTKLAGNGPTGAQVGVAMTEFDGKGVLHQIDTVTVGGMVVSDWTHAQADGNYSVNPDCTGTFIITFKDNRPPVTANFVVVENGAEIDTVVISAGGNQGILATRSIGKKRFFLLP